jgi:exopolysaccharide biosynthesis polyprenyl glycosylphosphotransferase
MHDGLGSLAATSGAQQEGRTGLGTAAAVPSPVASAAVARRPYPRQRVLLSRVLGDVGAIMVGLCAADGLQATLIAFSVGTGARVGPLSVFSLLVIAAWLVLFAAHGLYDQRRLVNAWDELKLILQAVASGTVVAVFTAFLLRVPTHRTWVLVTWLGCTLTVLSTRFAHRRILRGLRQAGVLVTPMLIVGAGREGREVYRAIERSRHLGYRVVGFLDDSEPPGPLDGQGGRLAPVLGRTDQIRERVAAGDIQAVLVAGGSVAAATAERVHRDLAGLDVDLHLSTGLLGVAANRVAVQRVDGIPVLALRRVELTRAQQALKRAFDLTVAAGLLAVLAPVMLACALAIRLTSPGPVLFRQRRVGQDGAVFTVHKFRSMTTDAEIRLPELLARNELDGPSFKLSDDPRVTVVGRLLRAWSLDELPQLLDVVAGHMSLVGPRPQQVDEAGEVDRLDPRAVARLRVKPGMSGLWQVSGRHGLVATDRLFYDLFYVENWSLALDLYVVLRTIPTVLRGSGV